MSMTRSTKRFLVAVAVAMSAFAFTACTGEGEKPWDERLVSPQLDQDRISSVVTSQAKLEPGSVRAIAEEDSVLVYVATSTDPSLDSATCIVVIFADDQANWASSCLDGGDQLQLSLGGARVALSAHGMTPPQWKSLGSGVFILSSDQ